MEHTSGTNQRPLAVGQGAGWTARAHLGGALVVLPLEHRDIVDPLPFAFVPLAVLVSRLPSLETTLLHVCTTLPPFFLVDATVRALIRGSATVSKSGDPETGLSLPS